MKSIHNLKIMISNQKQVTTIKTYNTPIYNYLREYAKQDINIFHMPGHKLSKGIPPELAQDILQMDVTEIDGTDNLHYAEGIIKEAEELATKTFGADKTFFLVNGSTCGIQAAIMSACARGQKIIIGRDSHKSVVSGLILSGAEPVFAYPEYNCEFGITEAITAKSIEKLLYQHPDAAAVLITRPNYYGICSDIEGIRSLVHSHNKLLIVDEAHGAHLAFNQKLPPSALKHGADICIQSAHKTLPAVTQGAYLHVKGNRVDIDKLKFNLSMLQTSSPSYIIMSYLDIARELMELEGEEKLDNLINEITWFTHEIHKLPEYKILSNEVLLNKTLNNKSLSECNLGAKTVCDSLSCQGSGAMVCNCLLCRDLEEKTMSNLPSRGDLDSNVISNSFSWQDSGKKLAQNRMPIKNSGAMAMHDPTRLVINISKLGISGYYAEKLLRERFKTQVEMADYENLVFITTIADSHETFSRLLESMKGLLEMKPTEELRYAGLQKDIIKNYYKEIHNNVTNIDIASDKSADKFKNHNHSKNIDCLPYEAYIAQKEEIPIEESCERICAGVITPYPPGIPVLYPGEMITKNQIQYINSIIEAGGKIIGINDNKYVQVVK